jgi:site-specific DNA-cytosine methylase
VIDRTFTALFPFAGLGGGALGFRNAEVRMLGRTGRFRVLGGIDFDAPACADFELLVDAPALCRDVAEIQPADLRKAYGEQAPDVVFLSPPCQGASGLLSEEKSQTAHYRKLNTLSLVWMLLMLETWNPPPKLVLLENVPRLPTRAGEMLAQVKTLLGAAGYVCSDGYHDCGEIGALAQHRRRYLMVARHARRVAPLLYQPPRRRVRGVGEVLGAMPLPEDAAAGPMHKLPRLSWLNWVRLALIPAGGDWRDLPAGSVEVSRAYGGVYGVLGWDESSGVVTGRASASTGAYAVADPRIDTFTPSLKCAPRGGGQSAYGVLRWEDAAKTITGSACFDNGVFAVADPRKPPSKLPVIIAQDRTWHRPLTTLELAALQGLPTTVRGAPLKLHGSSSSAWRTRIGNAVPAPAAQAIAERMLVALLEADAGAMSLSGNHDVWVEPNWAEVC